MSVAISMYERPPAMATMLPRHQRISERPIDPEYLTVELAVMYIPDPMMEPIT